MLKTKKFTRTTSIITALCLCLTAFSAFNLSAQAVVESENVPDGTYYIKKQGASFFLEPGTSIASNTYDMSQRLYKGNNVQAWRLETMSSAGYVRIVNVDTGLVLGIEGNSSADLARIVAQPWSSDNTTRMYQTWYLHTMESGKYEIVNRYTGKTFTNSGTGSGVDSSRIVQWPRRGSIWYEFGKVNDFFTGLSSRSIMLERKGDAANTAWLLDIANSCLNWNTSVASTNIRTSNSVSSPYTISVESIAGDVFGQTHFTIRNGTVEKAEIYINPHKIPNNDKFRQSVISHEFGHLFCLNDNPDVNQDNDSLMCHGRDRLTVYRPQTYDVKNVDFRYD